MIETPPNLNPWQPGRHGKGFTVGDRVFAWATEGLGDSSPVHDEGWYNATRETYNLGLGDYMYDNPFYLAPDGELAFYYHLTDDMDAVARMVTGHDARIYHKGTDAMSVADGNDWSEWEFTAGRVPPIADFAQVEHHLAPETLEEIWKLVNEGWQPGKEGKGLFVNNELYTWTTKDDDGWPHHHDVWQLLQHQLPYAQVFPIFYIGEDGEFDADSTIEDMIPTFDPRLHPMESGAQDWFKQADEGGGEGPGVEETGAYMGYPLWGIWGMASTRWQKHHRRRKKRKKRKKKSDFWDDQRRQDFPEDFEEDTLENTKPHRYTDDEIRSLVEEGWQEGREGKAIHVWDTVLASWVTDAHGGPHHDEVAQALKLYQRVDEAALKYIIISKEGEETSWDDINDDMWLFGSVDEDRHRLNWEEGNEGKGILDGDGVLHTWNGDDYETHNDYIDEVELNHENAHYLYITPQGKISTIWGTLTPEQEEMIREADPRLYADIDVGGAAPWGFGA